ncbi:hypothetical protein [Bosea sp. 117]|uniref:hypothetical protein n=1 Tax=Bosea sp. 117 TaxID=1125973 RepID=UPI0020BDC114|nr:hypothetical protein [Bosea sp. 117]
MAFAAAPASAETGGAMEVRSFDLAQAMPFTGTPGGPGMPPVTGFSPSTILNPNGLPPAGPGERDPHTVLPQPPAGKAAVGVSARFGEKEGLIPRGLVWRVFADKAEASGAYPLVAEAVEPAPVFFLSPGGYVLHVSYGLASSARKIIVGANSRREQLVIQAGAVKLQSDVNDKPIPAQKVAFDIFEGSFLQGKTSTRPFFRGANSGQLVVLPSGTYHVVSTYGEGNAVIQADLNVQPGKLTDAVIHHRAAEITLKLVQGVGGTALPDTQWSVLTPGGDTIKEATGAFPVFVLAEGEYAVIARHDGKTYTKEFVVESGKDTEVEVQMNAQAAPKSAQPSFDGTSGEVPAGEMNLNDTE